MIGTVIIVCIPPVCAWFPLVGPGLRISDIEGPGDFLSDRVIDGVLAEDIYIAFIQISESQRSELPLHSARDLAENLQLNNPFRFHHEYLFEWAIPEECVLHSVTLKTLLNRGPSLEKFMLHGHFPTTHELSQPQECNVHQYRQCLRQSFGVNLYLI
jgi:hypothetical protein